MRVALVGGTGDLGFGLALRLAVGGADVVIGSREADKAAEASARARERSGQPVRGAANPEAVAGADVVMVTVPFAGQAGIYRQISDHLPEGGVVCDTTSPLATAVGGRPTHVLRPWEGSAAEQAGALLPGHARLVSGFHTVGAGPLGEVEREIEGDVLLCGDEADAVARVGGLVDLIPGMRWVHCGPLQVARILEPLTAVLISVNRRYGLKDTGVKLVGRPDWGAPPDRDR